MVRKVILSAVCAAGLMLEACSQGGGTGATPPAAGPENTLTRAGATPVQADDSYYKSAAASVAARADGQSFGKAKNIILFVGDGMGTQRQRRGKLSAGYGNASPCGALENLFP